MNRIAQVTIGALMHDIGKIMHRGAELDGRAHSISGVEWLKQYTDNQDILDCVRYHHYQDIKNAGLNKDSPAYLVYMADNISSGMDRRPIEGESSSGFDKNRWQESVYNLLNNRHGQDLYPVTPIRESINYPQETAQPGASHQYNEIYHGISEGMRGLVLEEAYLNSLLELCEAYLSYVPSSTYQGEVADISLFDHSKTTAALASCMALYFADQKRHNYVQELLDNQDFYKEPAFCLFSCDISGIQQFIYTISSKGALKGLRSRSFYLEILMENLVDEILKVNSLFRTNLLYTGGGHAYILLPNTTQAQKAAAEVMKNSNQMLMRQFGVCLFISYGMQACSANELMSKTDDTESYRNIFRSVSAQISEMKLRRYSALEIRAINNQTLPDAGRECSICSVSDDLLERGEDTMCRCCAAFADISNQLIKRDTVLAVLKQEEYGNALPLYSAEGETQYLYPLKVDKVRQLLKNKPEKVIRVYSKNSFNTGLSLSTKLWMGDYAARNLEGELKTFAELAGDSRGIERIGVLRADVDDMGSAFVSGFIRENTDNPYRYLTLSRTSTLSRSLSIFFKYYLNDLLLNGQASLLADGGVRNLVVVYSGGDDLFIVGAWNEVLAAALDIRQAFARYTGGALTISAGFAVFDPTYPIARMASETAELEEAAKKYEYKGKRKNAISLFGREFYQTRKPRGEGSGTGISNEGVLLARHTYDWDSFEERVLGEKYTMIDKLFKQGGEYGNSFLYDILALLRESEHERINVARLAYLLARREPSRNAPDGLKQAYGEFKSKLYQWTLEDEDRRQLITAIIIYIYAHRDKKEGNQHE
ncbi:MAG: type III-A CRISPR-associated protein Cas10/Csm1 [Syntrophomonadaceae bacterium]